jgi:hypothetical protein
MRGSFFRQKKNPRLHEKTIGQRGRNPIRFRLAYGLLIHTQVTYRIGGMLARPGGVDNPLNTSTALGENRQSAWIRAPSTLVAHGVDPVPTNGTIMTFHVVPHDEASIVLEKEGPTSITKSMLLR